MAAVPGADPGDLGLREVEDGWSKAFVTGDSAYLEALLDPAYVSVSAQGDGRTKADIRGHGLVLDSALRARASRARRLKKVVDRETARIGLSPVGSSTAY
ncbi:MAG: hypothetical protein ABI609_17555, partial [Acidobacteriota bacterium]